MLVTVGILASRLIGLVRQKVVAHYLGTTDVADAVATAFRVANITQNLLGEGTLSASFVPVYAHLKLKDDGLATRFARALLGVLLTVTIVLSALGALFAPAIAGVIAGGFEGSKLALTAELVRLLFPMTGLLVLGAWSLGVLTAHRKFLVPYLAPVVWSVGQIVALIVGARALGLGADDLARAVVWGAIGGAGLQLLLMMIPVRALLSSVWPSFKWKTEGVYESVTRFPGALIARGVILISGLVDTYLVSFLGVGANATFQYAQTIYLLPMAVLGTGEAAAHLPDLAEQDLSAPETRRSVIAGITQSLTRVLTLAFAATSFFLVLGVDVTRVLFRGGSFDESSTRAVGAVLAAYALGLPANAASRILGTASFARGDTVRPALYAIVRVVVSTVVSVALMKRLGVPGVVIGAAVAAWVELTLLAINVRRAYGQTGLADVPYLRIVAAAAVPAVVGVGGHALFEVVSLPLLVSSLLVLIVAGVAFLAVARALRVLDVMSLLRRRR